MKPTLYPNGFPSAYEELKTFYPVFYRDVFEMDAIWRAPEAGWTKSRTAWTLLSTTTSYP